MPEARDRLLSLLGCDADEVAQQRGRRRGRQRPAAFPPSSPACLRSLVSSRLALTASVLHRRSRGGRQWPRPIEQHSREVAEGARQKTVGGPRLPARAVPGQLPLRLARRAARAEISPEAAEFFHASCATSSSARSTAPRSTRRASTRRAVIDGLRAARRVRDEDPEGVRRPRASASSSTARASRCCGRYDGNIVALLSAHQSIGVPQPLKLFGTEEQKQKYLPRCAARRDLGVRADRGRTSARDPGEPRDHRRAHAGRRLRPQRREALVHERHVRRAARRDGAPPRQPRRSAPSSSRPTGRASRSGTAAASWACGARERRRSASRTCACRRRT